MSLSVAKSVLHNNRNDIAFVFGNGINLHYNESNVSWKDLLLDLWDRHSFNTQSTIPDGITFTEFYDALEIQNFSTTNFTGTLQKDVAARMRNWVPNHSQNAILEKIEGMDAPILTTNFDDLIAKSLDLRLNRLQGTRFTDFYPWSSYFSNKELEEPTEGFGVWAINGMIKYHRSIKLGLSQYMGNVERARKLIHSKPEKFSFEGKNQEYWQGYKTWLHIMFNKSLFIFGLGLDETEIFFFKMATDRKGKILQEVPQQKTQRMVCAKQKWSNRKGRRKEIFPASSRL